MPNFRRAIVAGGTYFFTVVTHSRQPIFADAVAQRQLGESFRECIARWPFSVDAIVLLPDHLHAIWSLPQGDADFAKRWAWIKKEFTKAFLDSGGRPAQVSSARKRRGDCGVWQPRFWEHAIADEHDFDRHFDYIHYNPVKHKLVSAPREWILSSFHRWVKRGVYEPNWGSSKVLSFVDLDGTAMEPT